jgi:hypothetical protein
MAKFSDERVNALILGPKRSFRTIQFPGRPEVLVAVRALAEHEIDACRVEGQRGFLAQCKQREWIPERANQIDPLMFARLTDRQIIWRAFYDPDTTQRADPEQFFASEADVASLDSVTTSDLLSAYVEHQEFVSPLRTLVAPEVDQLVEALGKERPQAVLHSLGRDSLVSFTLTLAKRLASSQSGK